MIWADSPEKVFRKAFTRDIRPVSRPVATQMKRSTQIIRYANAPDGVKLAWAESGSGPVLIKAANWMTHLEYEWESPVWRHWMRFFSDNFRFIRHDERGCGMTDWQAADLSFDRWAGDLEAVIDAAAPSGPFALLGISQGAAACIGYAVKHPERVSKLILYGGYSLGTSHRGDPEGERLYRAMIDLVRLKWGDDNPTFRQVFTSRFIPKGTDEQVAWFNELCRKTTSGENAARLLEARAEINIDGLLHKVSAPTLVLHSRNDAVIPITLGRRLAAGIPGAQFVELESHNHVLLEDEPAWGRFCDEVLNFMGLEPAAQGEDAAFAALSPRERQVLSLLTEGLGNADIAERLSISEKTVRNHVSNIFDKLGVWTRAQAIVFARDRNFVSVSDA
jgi:pimeloyl-ACP methyl ester carboxylesterase/DNA-binding CsgD family transcriptional regulator